MDRRTICRALALGPLAAAGVLEAQPRVARVAWVSIDRASPISSSFANFRRGLADRGWAEGRNLELTSWWGEGSPERLRSRVPDLLASHPDVVVAVGGATTIRPLLEGGVTRPIVFTSSGDPVESGLVPSYARPGGQLTGLTFFLAELVVKRIEFLREMLPTVKRIGFVGWSRHGGVTTEVRVSLDAAVRAGIEAIYRPADRAADIDAAYESFAQWNADAVMAFADGVTLANAARLAELSSRHRLPTGSGWAEFPLAGNLFSYGPNRDEAYAQLASYVDRILKGARPGDLPVERFATNELVVNRQAARELGIRIPPALLARANQFIG